MERKKTAHLVDFISPFVHLTGIVRNLQRKLDSVVTEAVKSKKNINGTLSSGHVKKSF